MKHLLIGLLLGITVAALTACGDAGESSESVHIVNPAQDKVK